MSSRTVGISDVVKAVAAREGAIAELGHEDDRGLGPTTHDEVPCGVSMASDSSWIVEIAKHCASDINDNYAFRF
jgi:hypothetical protein